MNGEQKSDLGFRLTAIVVSCIVGWGASAIVGAACCMVEASDFRTGLLQGAAIGWFVAVGAVTEQRRSK